ncbi:hypothetical protein SLA2020_183160 [Shorea laevis]
MENGASAAVAAESQSPIKKIITVAAIASGVEFGWALQLSLLTPYVQTLGVPHAWAWFIWLCGPLSGLLVPPIVGYYSDRCTSRFGRRRPFITIGAVSFISAAFLIGFAKDIGHRAGDSLEKSLKPRAVAIFVVGFWVLDVANNMLQGPCRALLADLSANNHKMMQTANGWFSFFMAIGNVRGYLAGFYPKFYKILPFTKTKACDINCANLKSCFLINIILLFIVTVTAVTTVKEKPLTKEAQDEDAETASTSFVGELVSELKTLKKPMWILLLVTCLNWIAWFPFLLFDTDWMGTEVFGGKVTGNQSQVRLYENGVRAGALGLIIQSIILGLTSLALEPVGRVIGGVTNLWGLLNVILCLCLASTVVITKMAEAWRSSHGADYTLSSPVNIKVSALAVFGVLGIPLAVTYSIPFALASIYCSTTGGGQGLFLGVLNLSIVIPQMFVSAISGPMDVAFGGGNLPAFVLGSIAAALSALTAIFLLPKPPERVSLAPGMGGGH